jgi:catechol 2,3-dioxygenase-like lactoylglutathione lyase family enzyme
MMRAKLKAVHPVLPSQDVSASLGFYVDQLGFRLCSQDSTSAPKYAVVARDNVELHIQWHDPAEWAAVERPMLRIVTNSIKKLFDEYSKAGVFHEGTALRDTPWGTREFAFFDPYKNGLTFYCDT